MKGSAMDSLFDPLKGFTLFWVQDWLRERAHWLIFKGITIDLSLRDLQKLLFLQGADDPGDTRKGPSEPINAPIFLLKEGLEDLFLDWPQSIGTDLIILQKESPPLFGQGYNLFNLWLYSRLK